SRTSVFEELRTAIEELQVTNEELRQQNYELELTQRHLDRMRLEYQDLFEMSPLSYIVTDESGIIRDANHATCELLWIPRELLLRKSLAMYVDERNRLEFKKYTNQLVAGLAPQEFETLMQPRRGHTVAVSVNAIARQFPGSKKITLRW